MKKIDGIGVVMHIDQALKFMMQKYPNLESLNIWDRLDAVVENACRFTPVTVAKILSFVKSVPNYKLDHLYTTNLDAAAVLTEYWKQQQENAMVVGCCGTRESLSLEYICGPRFPDDQSITGFILSKRPFGDVVDYDKLTIKYSTIIDNVVSHLNLLEVHGSRLTILSLKLHQHYPLADTQETYKMMDGYCLDHIFEHCPQLQELHLSSSELFYCSPFKKSSVNQSITVLYLNKVYLCKALLPELSQ